MVVRTPCLTHGADHDATRSPGGHHEVTSHLRDHWHDAPVGHGGRIYVLGVRPDTSCDCACTHTSTAGVYSRQERYEVVHKSTGGHHHEMASHRPTVVRIRCIPGPC